jgi:hypothetical protein
VTKTKLVDALEEEAIAQLGEIRAYRVYQGTNPDYSKRAKLAIGVIGSYVRLKATLANEESNRLIATRIEGSMPKQLVGAAE